MDAKDCEIEEHRKGLAALFRELCGVPGNVPLVSYKNCSLTLLECAFSRSVTSDFGIREHTLPLPFMPNGKAIFWIGLHERWTPVKNRVARFEDSGVRLYFCAGGEAARQILRLEWAAPSVHGNVWSFDGGHAGHPHWHVDRAALTDGTSEAFIFAEPLPPDTGLGEDFGEFVAAAEAGQAAAYDCSWMGKLHLPAQSNWMLHPWNGLQVPGPHQGAPESLHELYHWWAGALRYLAAEIRY
ncbi:MAG TPA: hypothetical protein VNF74_07955 [Terriglobales bacterium]|nr:hypothetical protein [Terriglobales bacterium]